MRFRVTIRSVLLVTALVALALGWYSSMQNAEERIRIIHRKLQTIEREHQLERRRYAQRRAANTKARLAAKGVLWAGRLEGISLRNATIDGGPSAFQLTVFSDSDLEGATLAGTISAFQGANFEGARLVGAKLIGGASSFQEASFLGADLSGANLSGAGAAFQGATFKNANLRNARIACNSISAFQNVVIDGSQFQGADLSSIDAQSLSSCLFENPPLYDANTRFPEGFDPAANQWKQGD